MRDDIHALLAADPTLLGYLTGGVHSAGTVGEISRQNTPAAYDANLELLPCALVKGEAETPVTGPYNEAGAAYVVVIFYQRAAADQIDPALDRAYTLLHNQKLGGTWRVWHVGDLLDQEDQALAARMHTSRYQCVRLRSS
jgi:hypothetical protein